MMSFVIKIAASALFSLSSLLIILFRVSPLSSPLLAVPFFFLSLFLTVASIGSLAFFLLWSRLSIEGMDIGKKVSVSLREGMFLATSTTLVVAFLTLGILTWWIAVLLYLVFLLTEVALHS